MTKKLDTWDATRTLIRLRNQAPPLIPVKQSTNAYPLSLSQERLLSLEQISSTAIALYNIPYVFHIEGHLDLNALRSSLEQIIDRQVVLRTFFPIVDGQPKQVIQSLEAINIQVVDASDLSLQEVKHQMMTTLNRRFDLKKEAGFRYQLYRLAVDNYLLGFAFHHIISDFWSENVFFKEFAQYYQACLTQTDVQLPDLPIRYVDFALWQRQCLVQEETLTFLLNYWQQQLQGLEQPDFPVDENIDNKAQRKINFQSVAISSEQVTAIKKLGQESKVNTFTVLLSAFKLVLAEYLQTADIAVFSPITNRHRPELQHLIGDFSNLLILRTDLSKKTSVRSLLQRVGQVVSGAIAHQDLPLQLIKAMIPLKLPQVSFSYLNVPQQNLHLPDVSIDPWSLGMGTNDFDIFLLLMESKAQLTGQLKFNTCLLSDDAAKKLITQFTSMLDWMVAQPEQAIALSSLSSPTTYSHQDLLLPISELIAQIQQPIDSVKQVSVLQKQFEENASETHRDILKTHIRTEIKRILGVLPNDEQGFFDVGLDSLTSIQLSHRLALTLDLHLPATLTLEYPTVTRLSDYLAEKIFGKSSIESDINHISDKKMLSNEPIAIIGMGCRFPGGAESLEQFWQLLKEGHYAGVDIPASRWSIDEYYDPTPGTEGKMYVKQACFLQQAIEDFDPGFFALSALEAQQLDPRQRLLLEVTWETLENAGLAADKLPTQTGIFIGLMESEKGLENDSHDVYATTGTLTSMAAGRLAYLLGVHGVNITLDTACSSSIVALHQACQSLRTGESKLALAGGVNVILHPDLMLSLSKMTAIAPDGRSKTFDASADGFGRGEGCGMVALKRLSDAKADGDPIWAVIRGSAINHDGASSGLTVPNKVAQSALIRQALQNANISGEQISYVETHGTGTKLGDPIEVNALAEALGERETPLMIGSVKTNLGHLDAAAGMAGLIKVVLSLGKQEIPPHLHLKNPNPLIDWENLPFQVPTVATPWLMSDTPRLAGISSFGMSGTNAHAIVEEAPQAAIKEMGGYERPLHLFTLSAKTEQALAAQVQQYITYLQHHPDVNVADVCYTANTGRVHFTYRLAVLAKDIDELGTKLLAYQNKEAVDGLLTAQSVATQKVAFLFTGQGSQYPNMGRELYTTQSVFHDAIEECAEILASCLDIPLFDLLYGEKSDQLSQTQYTQPALFALEYALAKLWQSWGINPDVMIGHSVGEYVAACIAGVFSLADGLKLITARGALMQSLPQNGMMVAVQTDEARLAAILSTQQGKVSIAGFNAPQSLVLSGEKTALEQIIEQLQAENIKTKSLSVSHAFHSILMQPILAEFSKVASSIHYAKPQCTLISNLTGKILTEINAHYWVEHISKPVRFAQGMGVLAELNVNRFIEIGARPVLIGLGQNCLPDYDALWLASLYPKKADSSQLFASLAQGYINGITIDWKGFDKSYLRRKVALPTYPFQRKRYWLDKLSSGSAHNTTGHPLLGERLPTIATSKDIVFQNQISPHCPGYFNDHQVYNRVIVPATAYIEMVLAAGRQVEEHHFVLQQIVFLHPLVLSVEKNITIQLLLTPDKVGYQWQIFSQTDTDEWQQHATGELHIVSFTLKSETDLAIVQQRCNKEISVLEYENALAEGLYYGIDFQGMEQLFQGEKEALGRIKLPDNLLHNAYQIHPVLLDCCLRVVQLIPNDDQDTPYLPFNVEKVSYLRKETTLTSVWSYVKWRADISGMRQVDVTLFDDAGKVVALLSGFGLRQVERQALTGSPLRTDYLYNLTWQTVNLPKKSPYEDKGADCWLVIAEHNNKNAAAFADLLRQQGETVDVCTIDTFTLKIYYRGVVYFATQENYAADIPEKALVISCQVLTLVQQLAQANIALDLWLVIQNSVEESALWGFSRTLLWEQPQLNSHCIEITAKTPVETLFNTIWLADNENQIRLRSDSNQRDIARLEPLVLPTQEESTTPYPFRVELTQYGALESLQCVAAERQAPQTGQVEVQVRAVGLNFRDVLNAIGMLKEYYPTEWGFNDPKNVPFGFEAAGVVTQVGDAKSGFNIGDEVVVWQHWGSLASFITVDSQYISLKPAKLSFEEVATMPIVFLTAYYGLIELAGMKAGDKVLIHSGAGGVGQAAIQLAQHIGAKVFVTASKPKWDFLISQGIEHVMDSRSLLYAEQIQQITDGQGVDIVLNSLNGDYIQNNFDILAQNGRYIEMGKIDIWDATQAKNYRPDVSYYPIDWSHTTSSIQFRSKLETLLAENIIHPLPFCDFPIDKVTEAFQFMAKAKHIGKVVLSLPEQSSTQVIKPHSSYLLTGGLNGLGLKIANWLVEQGATHLVLSGRRKASELPSETQSIIAEMESNGASVKIVSSDIAQEESVKQLIDICQTIAPLKGIIHLAGVIDDGVVTQQTPARFAKIFAPKVQGSWYLHQHSQHLPLDLFVCFSSQTSLLGNGGQTNYACANAFMDALMHQRKSQGLPALSINWGGWSQVGMAKDIMAKAQQAVSPQQGVDLFGVLLAHPITQAGVIPEQWQKYSRTLPSLDSFPVLEKLVRPMNSTDNKVTWQQQFNQASDEMRYHLLKDNIKSKIELILGTMPSDEQDLFTDLNMDSLMSIQLSTGLGTDIGISIPVTTILEHSTVALLGKALLEMLSTTTEKHPKQVDVMDEDYEEGEL